MYFNRLLFTRILQEGYIFGELDLVNRQIKTFLFLFFIHLIGILKLNMVYVHWCLQVYFAPDDVHACIVTCGGLCPGLNTVIREIVHSLDYMYGVSKVLGIDVSWPFMNLLHLYNLFLGFTTCILNFENWSRPVCLFFVSQESLF